MTEDTVHFSMLPRFFVVCFYKDGKGFSKAIAKLETRLKEKTSLPIDHIKAIAWEPFKFRTYDVLGFLEIQIEKIPLETKVQPKAIYEISCMVDSILAELNTEFQDHVLFDLENPPYLTSVAHGWSGKNVPVWDRKTLEEHKVSVGKWVQFYSGQWPDYSEELWLSRIADNLSSRLTEFHFIRNNSAFIYIPEEGYEEYRPYMDDHFVYQIIRVKALVFSFYVLNEEIDSLNNKIDQLDEGPLKTLEEEIRRVTKFSDSLAVLSAHLFKQRIINRRAHSKLILNTCLETFDLELIQFQVSEKTDRLKARLEEARSTQRAKLSSQQKKWLMILNAMLSSQVAFSLRDRVIEQCDWTPGQFGYEFFTWGTWILVVLVALIAIIGLSYTWLSRYLGVFKPRKNVVLRMD